LSPVDGCCRKGASLRRFSTAKAAAFGQQRQLGDVAGFGIEISWLTQMRPLIYKGIIGE
jgi:hypothetical protein